MPGTRMLLLGERDYGEIITPEKDGMAFSYSTTRKMFLRVEMERKEEANLVLKGNRESESYANSLPLVVVSPRSTSACAVNQH